MRDIARVAHVIITRNEHCVFSKLRLIKPINVYNFESAFSLFFDVPY